METQPEKDQCRRAGKRSRLVLTATVMTPYGAYNVRIRDLSESGAQVCGSHRLPSNCDAVLKRGHLFAAARIVWSSEKEAGLRFYRTLEPEELDAKLATGRPGVAVGAL